MHRHVPCRRSSGSLSAGILKVQLRVQTLQRISHMVLTAIPGTLVHWLFLAPDNMLELGILRQSFIQIFTGERIKLLNAYEGNVVSLFGFLLLQQVIIDLATAKNNSSNLFCFRQIFLRKYRLEGS